MDEPVTEVVTEAELDALSRRVEERLAARRAAGDLPPALEAELDRYQRAYAALHATPPPQDRARDEVRRALARPTFAAGGARGAGLTGRARAVAGRAAGAPALADQVQQWRDAMEGTVVACIEAIDRFETDGLPAARDALAMVLDRLSALEVLEDAVADLEARLRAVEARLGPDG